MPEKIREAAGKRLGGDDDERPTKRKCDHKIKTENTNENVVICEREKVCLILWPSHTLGKFPKNRGDKKKKKGKK